MCDANLSWVLPPEVQPDDMLYVANRDLRICFTNDEWSRFAGNNNGQILNQGEWNRNVLDNMSGRERARWASIYEMLLDGRLSSHEEQFNCSSPAERRFYRLRITPQHDQAGSVAWLIHHAIREDDQHGQDRSPSPGLHEPFRDSLEAIAFNRDSVERPIEVDGFRAIKLVQPLEEVGGDFLWHRRHPDGITDLVHGDAMGHGEQAAIFAAKVLFMLNNVSASAMSPSRTIAEVNQRLAKTIPDDDVGFATGLFLRFRPQSEQLTACAFGHNGVLFSRTGAIPLHSGVPIGLTDLAVPWVESPISLATHGKRFLLFSDGISEQFNEHGNIFGMQRLLEVFRKTESLPLEQTLREIHDELERFRGLAIVKDDRTLLALEYEGGN